MADAQIANVLIPCLTIQLNNQQFIENDMVIGQTLDVPCRQVIIDEVGYWGVPVKDYGIFTKIQWILMRENNSVYVPQPTFDSFPCFRVRDKLTEYTWWIYGTKDQFLNSCNTAVGTNPVPMPGIDGQFVPMIAPCQIFCDSRNPANSAYRAIFGIPNPYGPDQFYPYGSYNNVAFPSANPAGYASVTALLAYLNSTWNTGGASTITWSASADGLTLFADGGALSDSICVVIARIGPSS